MKIHSTISIATLLICFLLCAGCSAPKSNAKDDEASQQNEQKKVGKAVTLSDRDKLELKGAVKRVEIIPSSGGDGLKDVYLFNESGNILEQSNVYRHDDRVWVKTVNHYDNTGRKIGTENFRDGTLIAKSVLKYKDGVKDFEEVKYDYQGKETGTATHKFDENGNLVQILDKMPNPQPTAFGMGALPSGEYKQVFTYDDNGNQNSMTTFMPSFTTNIKPFDKRTFVFNQRRQKIEETNISQTYENEAPRIFTFFYAYNQNGDVRESGNYESITESNVQTVRDKFKVIDQKNTVQNGYLISDKPGMILWTIMTYEYEYDSHGNWTKRISYMQTRDTEKPVTEKTVERIIQYF